MSVLKPPLQFLNSAEVKKKKVTYIYKQNLENVFLLELSLFRVCSIKDGT